MVEICDRTGKTRARFQLPHVDPIHQLDCCATSYIVTILFILKIMDYFQLAWKAVKAIGYLTGSEGHREL